MSAIEYGYVAAVPTPGRGRPFKFHRDPQCRYVVESSTLTEVTVHDGAIYLPPGPRTPNGIAATAIAAKCCTSPTTPDWNGIAACTGHPKAWWLQPQPATTEKAKRICAGCEVQRGCLAAADPDDDAIWGGLTLSERSNRPQALTTTVESMSAASPTSFNGQMLRQLRVEHKLSEAALAKAIGAQVAAVRQYEANQTKPSFARVDLIAEQFGVAFIDLLSQANAASDLIWHRERARLTPKEVAEHLGAGLSTISRWERSNRVPAPYRDDLATLYGIDPAALADDDEDRWKILDAATLELIDQHRGDRTRSEYLSDLVHRDAGKNQ